MSDPEKIYGNFTAEEIEAQYNLRARRPNYDTEIAPDWFERSAEARETLRCSLDIAYGASDRQKLDHFSTGQTAAPAVAYFHGGYWQRGEKAMYSFLAQPFVKQGVDVLVVGYDLCPAVSITTISEQAREAVSWIWRNATELGIARDRLTVMGHSAGGHITAMVMGTDWTRRGDDLPLDLVHAGIPISPLNELEPLRFTSINEGPQMDAAEAEAESPMNHPPLTDAPQLVVCGERETEEFHRQADIYVEAFATAARPIERYTVPASDHFDELNVLARDDSEFFAKCMGLIAGS